MCREWIYGSGYMDVGVGVVAVLKVEREVMTDGSNKAINQSTDRLTDGLDE